MRFLVVCFLALAGWVAAAPGTLDTTNQEVAEDHHHQQQQQQQQQQVESDHNDEDDGDDGLAPALSDLARRKRGSTKTNLPYSNYRSTGGMHRYRYPLYRKRSSYRPQPPAYDDEEEVILPEIESDYVDYGDQLRGPSLFRERSFQQRPQDRRSKKEMFLGDENDGGDDDDDGYFTEDFLPGKNMVPSPFIAPLQKKDSLYNLANTPYDLHTIARMDEMGKRDDDNDDDDISLPYDMAELNLIHSVGRKSPPRMSPTEQFYEAIDSIKKKKAMFDERIMTPTNEEKLEHLLKLKNFLSSAAASRYLSNHQGPAMTERIPNIRKKRDATLTSPKVTSKPNNTTTTPRDLASTVPARYKQAQLTGDRRKRAFNDYFNWERKALASEYQPMDKRSPPNKDFNDFLTREYFKSIARSVGQKKKRMAYAQFEADKRSSGLDQFLENPSMLQYMQTQLKEAEEDVAEEAEKELGGGDTEELLSNIVVRLDALERMREALGRLEDLQNHQMERTQRNSMQLSGVSGIAKKRQSNTSRGMPSATTAASSSSSSSSSLRAAEASSRKRLAKSQKKIKSAVDGRRITRMRRGDAILPAIFLGNTKEDCPVLERIVLNCDGVSEIVGDQDQAFLETCIRHEICYMCGSGLRVSGHECDAVLSSSLEATCSGNLDCLGAAGDTFKLLSDANRYDEEGTCTHDPCVRQFLESR